MSTPRQSPPKVLWNDTKMCSCCYLPDIFLNARQRYEQILKPPNLLTVFRGWTNKILSNLLMLYNKLSFSIVRGTVFPGYAVHSAECLRLCCYGLSRWAIRLVTGSETACCYKRTASLLFWWWQMWCKSECRTEVFELCWAEAHIAVPLNGSAKIQHRECGLRIF